MQIQAASETWLVVTKWANEKIDEAQSENEALRLDSFSTEELRVRIATLRELLELPVRVDD